MIDFYIDIDMAPTLQALDRLDAVLSDFRIPMGVVEEMIPGLMGERFVGFQKHAGTYANDKYTRKKGGLPVGVRSGKMFDSIVDGTAFDSKLDPFFGTRNAKLTVAFDLSKFDNKYPKYFDKWLRDRGDDLMSITPDHAMRISSAFISEVRILVSGAIK